MDRRKLGCAAGNVEQAGVAVVRVDPFDASNTSDFFHGIVERQNGRARPFGAYAAREHVGIDGEARRAPAAIAPRSAKAADLLLQDRDLDTGVVAEQVIRSPQAREPTAENRNVDVQ